MSFRISRVVFARFSNKFAEMVSDVVNSMSRFSVLDSNVSVQSSSSNCMSPAGGDRNVDGMFLPCSSDSDFSLDANLNPS